ncbi:HNH endonuclease [Calothrix sp. NIES-3974]|uniref:HNH endonuclease n=1 Tax=Calothrix sp. NIES-3974 TaxID=2005462 RepID=UPI000B5FAAC2|nr:HNH endonuclease signature motif containing protein [Calothrix sp. NIES-3974]BAZ03795.1 HNH endonuclease domain protein [Calothrix sp. NIES-3974]
MSVYISVDLQRQIRAKFAACCAYCHTAEYLTVTNFEFEHITPLSSGGETVFENLCLSCPSCNRYKASRQSFWDEETKQQVSLLNPQQQIWSEHFAWSENGTEIIALDSVGRVTVSALKMNRPQLVRVRKMWVRLGEHPPNI